MKLWYLIKISAKESLTYRADFVMAWISGSLLITINYYLWFHVFSRQQDIKGYSFTQTFSYMAMVWVLSGFLNTSSLSRNLQNSILSGKISYDLCLPIHFQIYTLIKGYAGALIYLVLSGLPIFITAGFLFGMPVPTPLNLLVFLISIHLSFLTACNLSFIVGMMTVNFKNIEGLLQAERFLRTLLSGALLPLAFFPDCLQSIAAWLPFQTIVSIPVQIFLGTIPSGKISYYLLLQASWTIVIGAMGYWLYCKAIHRLEGFGG